MKAAQTLLFFLPGRRYRILPRGKRFDPTRLSDKLFCLFFRSVFVFKLGVWRRAEAVAALQAAALACFWDNDALPSDPRLHLHVNICGLKGSAVPPLENRSIITDEPASVHTR